MATANVLFDVQAESAMAAVATPSNAGLNRFIMAIGFSYFYVLLFYGCKITTYYSNHKMFECLFYNKSVYFTLIALFLTFVNGLGPFFPIKDLGLG